MSQVETPAVSGPITTLNYTLKCLAFDKLILNSLWLCSPCCKHKSRLYIYH